MPMIFFRNSLGLSLKTRVIAEIPKLVALLLMEPPENMTNTTDGEVEAIATLQKHTTRCVVWRYEGNVCTKDSSK
ncbi:MAG: hypothetical protein NVS2B12_21980 [Ktedonobacteraceae bacterium]